MQIVHKSSDIFCFKIRKKKERKKDARELLAPVTRRGCHANQRHLSLRCWSSGGMEKNEQSVMRAAREQEKNKIDGTICCLLLFREQQQQHRAPPAQHRLQPPPSRQRRLVGLYLSGFIIPV